MRRFLLTVFVGLVIFGVIAWSTGLFLSEGNPVEGKTNTTKGKEGDKQHKDMGPSLYQGQPLPEVTEKPGVTGKDPVIFGSHWVVIDKADVSFLVGNQSSQNEGKLLFVGKLVPDYEPDSPRNRHATMYRNGKPIIVRYYKLQEGDFLNYKDLDEGAMIAQIDTTLVDTDVAIRRSKVAAADADWRGAEALAIVYAGEVQRFEKIMADGSKFTVSQQEYQIARAQRDKYKEDSISKKKAIDVAKDELTQSQTVLKLFTLRNPIRPPQGARTDMIQIKTVYKNSGEVVRNQEPVLQVQDLGRLRAEGLVDVQYLSALHKDQEVIVLPTQRSAPYSIYRGHRGEITALAVSHDKEPLIVSGSEDGTVRVWKLQSHREQRIMYFHTAVRSLACSPPSDGKESKLLVGLADGTVQLWDLSDAASDKPVWSHEDQASDAINCLAFSPDGTMYVTGSEDNSITLWNTNDGSKRYPFDADQGHQGGVTAVHFTPDLKVVSAGRDNTLRVWTLYKEGAATDTTRSVFANRGGNVTQLGVSADGQYMLFDQGKTLQVLSLARGRTVGNIQDLTAGTPFETIAAFSPDGGLVLTANSSEGRLQLWKTPTGTGTPRTFEVQQLATKEPSRPTCAAFGTTQTPEISPTFVVTGTKDGLIYLWEVPGKNRIDRRLKGKISFKEAAVDPSSKTGRVWVDVVNEDGTLIPGETVTLVVPRK